jgi:hypothetical protein
MSLVFIFGRSFRRRLCSSSLHKESRIHRGTKGQEVFQPYHALSWCRNDIDPSSNNAAWTFSNLLAEMEAHSRDGATRSIGLRVRGGKGPGAGIGVGSVIPVGELCNKKKRD